MSAFLAWTSFALLSCSSAYATKPLSAGLSLVQLRASSVELNEAPLAEQLAVPNVLKAAASAVDFEVVGLAEYPYSGSTWLRFLLAGAAGIPSCAVYPEDQCSCKIDVGDSYSDSYCPCTEAELAKFSPRGWETGKDNALDFSGVQPLHGAFEYVPGVQVHRWTPADRIMLRKTHLFAYSQPHTREELTASYTKVPEIRTLQRLVLLLRHPSGLIAANNHEMPPPNMPGVAVDTVNNWYVNAWALATENFGPGMVYKMQYESLCTNTAYEVQNLLVFLGHGDGDKNPLDTERMIKDWPELQCRYDAASVLPPVNETLNLQLRHAITVWEA